MTFWTIPYAAGCTATVDREGLVSIKGPAGSLMASTILERATFDPRGKVVVATDAEDPRGGFAWVCTAKDRFVAFARHMQIAGPITARPGAKLSIIWDGREARWYVDDLLRISWKPGR